jgi:hypothetical protein
MTRILALLEMNGTVAEPGRLRAVLEIALRTVACSSGSSIIDAPP